jgi:hypothetical protein
MECGLRCGKVRHLNHEGPKDENPEKETQKGAKLRVASQFADISKLRDGQRFCKSEKWNHESPKDENPKNKPREPARLFSGFRLSGFRDCNS